MSRYGFTDIWVDPAYYMLKNEGAKENLFFSSRRRHTRFDCDWSSDVCSSDLYARSCSGSTVSTGVSKSSVSGTSILWSASFDNPESPSVTTASTRPPRARRGHGRRLGRSEKHTSELQSPSKLACRLLLGKNKR